MNDIDHEGELHTMYGYGNHLSTWGWVAMTLGMVVFWGLVIAGVVLLTRSLRPTGKGPAVDQRTPEQVLDLRFAQGEIDEAEYRARIDALHTVAHTR